MNAQRQKPSRPSWAIGRGKTERPAVDLVIDATSLPDAVHEDLELARNMGRQLNPRLRVHGHRMPARVRRKLLLLTFVGIAALAATAGVAAAANGGFAPVGAGIAERGQDGDRVLRDPRLHGRDLHPRRDAARRVRLEVPQPRQGAHGRGLAGARPHAARADLDGDPGDHPLRDRARRLLRAARDLERPGGRGPAAHHGRRAPVLLAVRLPERRALDRRPARTGRPGRRPERRLLGRDPQLVDSRSSAARSRPSPAGRITSGSRPRSRARTRVSARSCAASTTPRWTRA